MNATTGRAGRFSSLRNVISLAGAAVTTGSAVLFAVLFLLQLLGYLTNPYLGLVVFGVLPLLFLLGLLLIPVGIVWARGHVERTLHTWPRLDLNEPRHRWLTSLLLVGTLGNLVILSTASYGAIHYMESVAFCGTVCHSVMAPVTRPPWSCQFL